MKLSAHIAKWMIVAVLAVASSVSSATIIFQDDFETGGLAKVLTSVLGTAKWGTKTSVAVVSTTLARSGNNAAKFSYGNWAELRFDLGKLHPEVWMQMDLYIPSNYVHNSGGDGPNNKLFRLWGNTYDDIEKVGYSNWRNSSNYSNLITDWNLGGAGIGPKGNGTPNFIGPADLGKWMRIKIQVKAATATSYGTMKLWKNGVLLLDDTNKVNNYTAGESHAYRYGYLLGWANSAFVQATDLYIDDVIFATSESELGGVEIPLPKPPTSVTVQ